MQLSLKPDFDKTLARFEAFLEREITDRPLVTIALPKEGRHAARPRRVYASLEERWLDLDARIEDIEAELERTDFANDSLPILRLNLGYEISPAWCGCGYEYEDITTRSKSLRI